MKIDLTNIPSNLNLSLSDKDILRLQSNSFMKGIKVLSTDYNLQHTHNFIIMPISIYNIVENHPKFTACQVNVTDGIFKVGELYGYDCYVDMTIFDNRIIISKNLQATRENKINSILGLENLQKDLEIDIIL